MAWLIAAAALVAVTVPRRRRTVLACAAVPVAVCLALYIKNGVMFGSYSASTCGGVNLSHITVSQLPPAQLRRLVATHVVSTYALPGVAYPYDVATALRVNRDQPRRGNAVLDRPLKSTGGLNFDSSGFLALCRRYESDAVAVLTHRPSAYLHGVKEAAFIYFRPASEYIYFDPANERAVHRLDAPLMRLAGQLDSHPPRGTALAQPLSLGSELRGTGWLIVLEYTLAVTVALGAAIGGVRTRRPTTRVVTLAFIALNLLYVAFAGIALDLSENNRFRFVVSGLALAALATGLQALLERRRVRRRRAAANEVTAV